MSSNVLSSEEQQAHVITDFPYRLTGEPAPELDETPQPESPLEPEPVAPPAAPLEDVAAASEVAKVEREAFERGYREGEAAAIAAADSRLQPARERLEESIRRVASLREHLYRQSEQELVKLALSIAAKVVRREIALDTTIVATMVRISLERVSQSSAATVRLNPADYQYLEAAQQDGAAAFGAGVTLVEDLSVDPGGCVVETDAGDVDARIDVQLQEISESLLSAF